MEINSLAAAYADDYRLSAVPALASGEGSAADTKPFAEMLADAAHPEDSKTETVSPKVAKIDKQDKLYEQCLELETFLVKSLIGSMRKTVEKSGLVNEGFAGKMYEDMLYDEYAKEIAHNANFGLAEQAYLELSGQRGYMLPKELM